MSETVWINGVNDVSAGADPKCPHCHGQGFTMVTADFQATGHAYSKPMSCGCKHQPTTLTNSSLNVASIPLSALIQRVRVWESKSANAHDVFNATTRGTAEEWAALSEMGRIDEQRDAEYRTICPQLADAAERLQEENRVLTTENNSLIESAFNADAAYEVEKSRVAELEGQIERTERGVTELRELFDYFRSGDPSFDRMKEAFTAHFPAAPSRPDTET